MRKRTLVSFVLSMPVFVLFLSSCGPSYPNCETDEHCKDHNQVCVNGTCHDCRTDDQCKGKMGACGMCNPATYTCEKPQGNPGDCCTTDLDCKNGKCWKEAGAETGQCAECTSDTDCKGPRMQCVQGKCVSKAECQTDSDCPSGKKCENGTCITASCELEPVYFDFDQYELRADARETLQKDYECIKRMGRPVRVEGNCDERGSDEYNQVLGRRRADAVKNYLVQLGIAASQISTISYGEERPVCMEHNEECWQKNRRADLKFQ